MLQSTQNIALRLLKLIKKTVAFWHSLSDMTVPETVSCCSISNLAAVLSGAEKHVPQTAQSFQLTGRHRCAAPCYTAAADKESVRRAYTFHGNSAIVIVVK